MSSITDFLRPSGGGLKPKYQEFLTSGTFTPTQAMLDAGGVIDIFIVGGGAGGNGANGGEVIITKKTITDLTPISVTIGAGGSGIGGGNSSSFGDLIALGGEISDYNNPFQTSRLGSGWSSGYGTSESGSAGNGTLGYGAGARYQGGAGGIITAKSNSGQGASTGTGGSGYCLINWGE